MKDRILSLVEEQIRENRKAIDDLIKSGRYAYLLYQRSYQQALENIREMIIDLADEE